MERQLTNKHPKTSNTNIQASAGLMTQEITSPVLSKTVRFYSARNWHKARTRSREQA